MKKRILSMLLVLVLIMTLVPAAALAESSSTGTKYEVEGGYLYFDKETKTITKCECNESNTEIIIPAEIDGVAVEKISTGAFDLCKSLKSIEVDSGNSFFSSQDGVLFNSKKTILIRYPIAKDNTEYTVPEGVESIAAGAFTYVGMGAMGEIPEKIAEKAQNASSYEEVYNLLVSELVSKINSITITSSVTSIGSDAFAFCNVKAINVNSSNSKFSSSDGVLFNKGQTELIQYPMGKTVESYNIPASVRTIGEGAFAWAKLKNITIPNSVESVGNKAFLFSALKSITLSSGMTSISDGAFALCICLTDVTIPSSVTSIGVGAFSWCFGLASVTIPNNVTSIGEYAFFMCSSLKDITIPASVTKIDPYAFDYASTGRQLDNVYFGGSSEQWQEIVGNDSNLNNFTKTVHFNYSDHDHDFLHGTVGTDSKGTYVTCAVAGCTERTYATVETGECGENLTYTKTKIPAENGYDIIVVISGTGQMCYYNGGPTPFEDATEIIFEDGATWISMGAFCENKSLRSVTLPSTLKKIDWQAFTNCSNLESITFPEGLDEIGWRAFAGCDKIKTVTIPSTVTLIDEPFENMKYYNVADGNTEYKSIDGALYSKDGKTLYNYPGARTGKAVVSDQTETIGSWAFENAAELTSIVIPASVIKIENDTFEGCSKLKVIFFGGTQEQWDKINFTECQHIDHLSANYTSKKYLEDNNITVVCLNTEPTSALTAAINGETATVSISGYGNAMNEVKSVTIEKTTLTADETATLAVVTSDKIQAYDISLENESGASVQPKGYVQVRLKVPTGYEGSKCVVYHQVDNTLVPVDAELVVKDGVQYLVFITNSFSPYIVYQQHDHKFGEPNTIEPTCTAPGSTNKTCTVDDCGYVSTTEIPATGHNAPLTGAKDATCTEDGSTGERRCEKCHAILQVSQVIKAAGHTYKNGVCTTCGAKDPSYRPYIPPVHTHSYTKTVTAPTCTEKGYTTYTCTCGYSYVDDYVNAKGHTEVVDAAVAATCEKTGLSEGKHCSVCNAVITAQKETPKTAHTEVVDAAVAATCEKTGLSEGKHCSVCNAVITAQKETPKTAHSFDKGFCTVCGAVDSSYVPFKDVKEGDEFYADIMWAWQNHIIIGDENGNYNAGDALTRAQVVTMLWRLNGSPKAEKAAAFTDLTQDWYKDAVAWAVEKGIIKGIGNNLFDPDGACTRAMFVTMLWRLNGFEKAANAAAFTDLTQDWYKDAVAWAASNGVTKGTGADTFSPDDNCTRGQAAAFLHRLAQLEK